MGIGEWGAVLDDIRRVRTLEQLAVEPARPVGTRIHVDEDHFVYISVGNTRPEIAERLGWTGRNVWMPDHVERYLHERHPEISPPVEAVALVLGNPLAVHREPIEIQKVRFIASADDLRAAGLISSRSMKLVDVMVELRDVGLETVLRTFHLAPTRHGVRGPQLWP